jgi:hypothetical protein
MSTKNQTHKVGTPLKMHKFNTKPVQNALGQLSLSINQSVNTNQSINSENDDFNQEQTKVPLLNDILYED